jgi:sigma-B regulation protein RsbU (phosphoserine phosphatase)
MPSMADHGIDEPADALSRTGSRGAVRVLVADDQPDVLTALRLLLKSDGFETEAVDSPRGVIAAVKARQFDLLLMDLNYARDTTSGREGLDLLPRLRVLDPSLPVVVMTAWGSIDLAVEAMRRGATDFVTKPWENASLLERVRAHAMGAREARPPADGGTARDLTAAGRVQARMRPNGGPPLATLEYGGQCSEAEAVGGDGYDFVDLGAGRLGVLLADVSGKGVPAALLMAHLQATIRSQLSHDPDDLAALLARVNGLFHAATATERYATAFLGVYDDSSRRLRYVNCGHNPPFVLRRDGSALNLPPGATVLGLMEDWTGREETVELGPGDTLLVYSDGVTEACRPDGEEFGEARLLELLRRLQSRPLAALPAALLAAVDEFGGIEAEDDRTVVVARGRSPGFAPSEAAKPGGVEGR